MSSAPDDTLPRRPTWAEIDLAAFDRNLAAMTRALPEGSRLVAVLKGNAYGHGAVALGRRCVAAGAPMIAVALLEEAVELRRAAIELPILVLGPLTAEQLPVAMKHHLVLGIVGPIQLAEVCSMTIAEGETVAIHLKLDSGMGRMGLVEDDFLQAIALLRQAKHVRLEAVYTHFANASDPDDPYTGQQKERFERMLGRLREAGIVAPLHHVANSATTVRGLVNPGDWVRCGIALLGGEALDIGSSRLEPLIRWRTEIVRLKDLPEGSGIGYGTTFITTRASTIATLPVGYADGYDRGLSNGADVLVRGRRAKVVGRVSMDLVTIDVTDVPGASVGDEVVLLGRQNDQEISAEEMARKAGTINYEVFCNISARVPRVYR